MRRFVLFLMFVMALPAWGALPYSPTVSLTQPTTRADGEALPRSELAEHRVRCELAGGSEVRNLVIPASASDVGVSLATRSSQWVPGEWSCFARSVDSAGNQSAEVAFAQNPFTLIVNSPAAPIAPSVQ